ncbi:MAG: hypothetical protein JSV80_07640 [Acidobacteriota bacterium]|nr:MAG: hypothetical protein JSV80_07640 [Acidobacteriota bacterium]
MPIPFQSTPANIGFHDVEYHSGEPYDGADWTPQANASEVVWQTQPFAVNPDANALRWGTLYNFRFDLAAPPESGLVTLGMFQPGSPTEVSVPIVIPKLCDDDGSCEPREDCANCLFDCPDSGPDADADTFIVCEDCNDADGDVWATPGEARNLRIMADGSLEWEPPLDPGGNVILYETLRSDDPADFVDAVICLADANPQDTAASDGASPPVGGQFSYLVRATNVCPDGEGPLGDASSGLPREGASCP